jgi:hypothetical protein
VDGHDYDYRPIFNLARAESQIVPDPLNPIDRFQENYNAVLQSTSYGFLPQYIEALSRRETFKDVHRPRLMVMSADACGGGNDEFAITMGYRLGDKFIVRIYTYFYLFLVCYASPSDVNCIMFSNPAWRIS